MGASVTPRDLTRRGLDESLEAYAARIGRTPDEARHLWRIGALVALRVPEPDRHNWMIDVDRGLCRIAPGVSVPTRAVTWSEEVPS
jgi:hypothetical protein